MNSPSCASVPCSSQSSTASTSWSNSACAAHSASSGATSGSDDLAGRVDGDVAQRQCVLAELGLAGRVAPQQPEPVGPFARDLEQGAGAAAGFEALGDVGEEQLDLALEDLLEHRPVEQLLAREVPVDDQLRDLGRRRDLVHRGGGVSGMGEGLGRGLQHRQAPGRAPAA